jgi:hypothetical protein
MKTDDFIRHDESTCPVADHIFVYYRTVSKLNPCSHVHFPVQAGILDWSWKPEMGRIRDYKIAPIPKLAPYPTSRARGLKSQQGLVCKRDKASPI